MAIRTVIRGLGAAIRAAGAAPSRRGCLAFGAALLLISSTAAADYAAGLAAFNRKDYAHAFSEWIESAKAGDAHAQHGLGMLYELGQGVPYADAKAAADWYQKAAAQNYAPALNNLARLHADGRGVKQDVPKAIELWSKAAEAGNTTARFNLGLQYASGAGVPKDMKKAAAYMLQAAESGLAEAQFAVAGYYREGTGVAKDMDAAKLWYERAAASGFEPARAELEAMNKPAVDATPAVEESAAAPAESQQAQKMQQPPAPSAEAAAQPAENPPQKTEPAETSPVTTPPPAEVAKQLDAPTPPEAAAEAATEQAPAGASDAAPAEAAQVEASAPEDPAGEGSEATSTQIPESDLPVAESLTGDARIYRIWLYTSGQEGDARSYWDKLTMQYPGLLKTLELDIRRYFLGEARGSLYRVFAGPFEDLGAAQKACEDIRQRFGDQFCRPVLN